MRWSSLFPKLPAQLWLLTLAAFINFLGFMVTPFLVLYLTQATKFTVELAGLLLTLFGAGNIAGAWIGGRLVDRIGSANVMVLSFLISAFTMSVLPVFSHPVAIGIALIIMAFANGAFRPAYDSSVVRLCTADERSHAYAVYVVAINVGAGVAAALGGYLYSIQPSLIFYADAFSSLIAAILVLCLYDRRNIHEDIAAKSVISAVPTSSLKPYGNIAFLVICLSACVVDIVAKQSSATLPLYATSAYGMSPSDYGSLLTIGYVAFAAGMIPVATWIKTRNPLKIAIFGMLIVAAAFALLPLWSGVIVLVALYLLLTLGQLLFYPAIMAIVMGEAGKYQSSSGEYMGFYRTMQSTAGIAAPSIGTFVYAQASPAVLWYFCSFITVGAAIMLFGRRSSLKVDQEALASNE